MCLDLQPYLQPEGKWAHLYRIDRKKYTKVLVRSYKFRSVQAARRFCFDNSAAAFLDDNTLPASAVRVRMPWERTWTERIIAQWWTRWKQKYWNLPTVLILAVSLAIVILGVIQKLLEG